MIFKCIYLLLSVVWIYLIYRYIKKYEEKQINRFVLAVSLYVFNNIACSTILCCIYPFFSLKKISLVLLLEIIVLIIKVRPQIELPKFDLTIDKLTICKLAVICMTLVLYLGFPMEYMDAGRDPGGYFLGALRIANTGGWSIAHDANMVQAYDQYPFLWEEGYYGFYSAQQYGLSDNRGDTVQQFLPGAPAIFALGYAFGGFPLLIRVNGIIAILGLLLLYLYLEKVFKNEQIPCIAFIFLALSPAYLWNARETTTEIIMFFLIMLGVYIDSIFEDNAQTKVVSGMILGFIQIVRIDICVFSLAMVFREILFVVSKRNRRKFSLMRLISYCLVSFSCMIYAYFFSYPYWIGRISFLKPVLIVLTILLVIYAATYLIDVKSIIVKKFGIREELFRKKIIISIIGSLLTLILVYAYFIRPNGTNAGFNERSMVEFCWYTSLLAVALAIVGILHVITDKELIQKLSLFMIGGGSYFLLYIYRPSITEDHMWASRRWVSLAIPFVFVMASIGIAALYKKISKAAWLLVILVISYLCYQDVPFMFKHLMVDLHSQFDELANNIEDDKIYVGDNAIATVMRFAYGKNVYVTYDWDALEEYLTKTGEEIYFIGDEFSDDLEFDLIYEFKLDYETLEKTIARYPRKIVNNKDEYPNQGSIYKLSARK